MCLVFQVKRSQRMWADVTSTLVDSKHKVENYKDDGKEGTSQINTTQGFGFKTGSGC